MMSLMFTPMLDKSSANLKSLKINPLDKVGRVDLGKQDLLVLGVDPGFGRTGLGVINISNGKTQHIWHSVIDTPSGMEFIERLQTIRNDLTECLRRFSPQVAAVEKLFFQTNVRTALKVGMARGVVLLVLADASLPLVELTPNEIKQAVTGYGSADKKQVQDMVVRLLKLSSIPKPDDAADALAIAMAGGFAFKTQQRQKGLLNH